MNTPNNKKAYYTKQLVAKTLLEMLDSYSFKDLTISQICQYSTVARASFYRNFQSKGDIIVFIIEEIIDKKLPDKNDERRMFLYSEYSLATWFDEKDLFKKLYDNDLFDLFTSTLNTTITSAFSLRSKNNEDAYYQYLATEMAYIISSIFYVWTSRGFKETKEEMNEMMIRLFISRSKRELLF